MALLSLHKRVWLGVCPAYRLLEAVDLLGACTEALNA